MAAGQGAPSTIRCIKTHPFPSSSARCHRQGAPSTIRCIKTRTSRGMRRRGCCPVREHPAPSGALRRGPCEVRREVVEGGSGNTQHHQVRSRLCSRKPGCGPQSKCQEAEAGRCCGGASRGRAVSGPPAPFCCEVRTQGARIRQRRSHTRAGSSRCVRCCVA